MYLTYVGYISKHPESLISLHKTVENCLFIKHLTLKITKTA